MDWKLFVSAFSLVFLAELPDKTAFAALLLATRGKPWAVFVGAAAAFVAQSAIAIGFGSLFAALPRSWVRVSSGVLFLAFAIAAWLRGKEDQEAVVGSEGPGKTFWREAAGALVVIFIAEWGDLTQLATASLQARFRKPWTIFLASILALWLVTIIAVIVGSRARHMIRAEQLNKLAALAFAVTGIYLLST